MRRLPNRSNNYNGHGRMTALPFLFLNDPKTVRRRLLSNGQELMITEAQAAHETSRSWGALPGHTLTEVLDTGSLLVTLQACYWKPEARQRRRAMQRAQVRRAA